MTACLPSWGIEATRDLVIMPATELVSTCSRNALKAVSRLAALMRQLLGP